MTSISDVTKLLNHLEIRHVKIIIANKTADCSLDTCTAMIRTITESIRKQKVRLAIVMLTL